VKIKDFIRIILRQSHSVSGLNADDMMLRYITLRYVTLRFVICHLLDRRKIKSKTEKVRFKHKMFLKHSFRCEFEVIDYWKQHNYIRNEINCRKRSRDL